MKYIVPVENELKYLIGLTDTPPKKGFYILDGDLHNALEGMHEDKVATPLLDEKNKKFLHEDTGLNAELFGFITGESFVSLVPLFDELNEEIIFRLEEGVLTVNGNTITEIKDTIMDFHYIADYALWYVRYVLFRINGLDFALVTDAYFNKIYCLSDSKIKEQPILVSRFGG